MIGKSSAEIGRGNKSIKYDFAKLYKHIFPVIFKIGSDSTNQC